METIAAIYVPLAAAIASLIAVTVSLWALYYVRHDRREAQLDAIRAEQEALSIALQGEKEAMGFLALQLVREPHLVTTFNRTRLCCALSLAFVFESSSRSRALVLKALRTFSETSDGHKAILGILQEIEDDFRAYGVDIGQEELTKYLGRIENLKSLLTEVIDKSSPETRTASDRSLYASAP